MSTVVKLGVVKRVFFFCSNRQNKGRRRGREGEDKTMKGGSGWVSKEESLRGCVRRLL